MALRIGDEAPDFTAQIIQPRGLQEETIVCLDLDTCWRP
jgi:hypothetical protein